MQRKHVGLPRLLFLSFTYNSALINPYPANVENMVSF